MTAPSWASEPGLSQVICGCGAESFTFLVSAVAIRLLCPRCGQVNGDFTRPPQWQPAMSHGDPPALPGLPVVPGSGPPPPVVHLAWVDDGGVPIPGEIAAGRDMLPMLAQASPQHANVILDSGPYHGHLLAMPPDVDTIALPGGTYRPTGEIREGRRVFSTSQGG